MSDDKMNSRVSSHADVSRRTLVGGMAGVAAMSLMARGAFAQGAAKEAPDLAKLVAESKLPPLAQRLPVSPLVVTPVEKVGVYGGSLRRGLRGSADHNGILRLVGSQGLVRWNLEFTETLPNVAEKWEVNSNATEYTFYLRKGMKWSDGQPFTADDVVFAIEDCAKNTDLYKSPPSAIVIGGKAAEVTKVDETTVKFKFASPYGLFLENLATPLGQHPTLFAKHYCSQFHPKYNTKVADEAKAANLADWMTLFRAKCGDIEIPSRWGNPAKPTLDPWTIAEPYVGGATRVVMKRNPYFWQVDTAGNQLPYLDGISFGISQDVESLMLEAISGRLDIQERHIDTLQNKPTLAQNQQKGNYHFFETTNANSQQMMMYPNITHKDPKMREMFANKDFRRALSIGMNRAEIIDLVYLGQSKPWNTGPREGHPWYHEKLATQNTQYDAKEANAILDKLGYSKKDGQGFRLRPDGQKVFFAIDVIPTLFPDQSDVLELVKRHWAAIGIDVKINTIERALFFTRGDSNEHDMQVWQGPGGLDPVLDARDYLAMHPQGTRYAIPWAVWYVSNGKEGQEPPEHQKKRLKLFDDIRATADLKKRGEMMKELLDIAADQFECFGPCLATNLFGIQSNRLKNVPAKMPNSWSWPHPGPAMPQQFYIQS